MQTQEGNANGPGCKEAEEGEAVGTTPPAILDVVMKAKTLRCEGAPRQREGRHPDLCSNACLERVFTAARRCVGPGSADGIDARD